MKNSNCNKTSIGGQAVIEGVMMRGKTAYATAVRAESGDILVESKRLKSKEKSFVKKIPILRGVFAFFDSLIGGTKVLSRSATVFGEDESSNFDKWLSKKTGKNATDIAVFFGVVLGLVISLFLFFFLPQKIADLFYFISPSSIWYYLLEGLIRLLIFITYILLTSLLKDIRRTFMYHGAEHKTIACYESGKELTVENVKKCSRIHDRCGTTFMFLVMIISILVFSLVNVLLGNIGLQVKGGVNSLYRFCVKLLSLPIVAGVSYEILKLLSKTQSKWVYIFKAPGILLQKITTKEPDDKMIEVAITSFNTVLEMDNDISIEEKSFNVQGTSKTLLAKVKKALKSAKIEDESEAEWIVALSTNLKRSEIHNNNLITKEQIEKAIEITLKRKEGVPLWYIIGNTEFYGYKINVNESVLIPRPETEELVQNAISLLDENKSVLDLCTGSGAIAISIKLETNAKVLGVDVSEKALEVAKQNAMLNDADVEFVSSDMFNNVEGLFDMIISNPPYIKSEDIKNLQKEVKKEPILALDGGEDGLKFYKIIAEKAYEYLKDGGYILLECGINQSKDIVKLLKDTSKYTEISVILDINGIDRIIKARKL